MKQFYLVFLISFLTSVIYAQENVGIGTVTPDSTALLDLSSQEKGLLIPRLTSQEKNSILNPANSLLVYDLDTESFWFYKENQWVEIGSNFGTFDNLPTPAPFEIDSSVYFNTIVDLEGNDNTLYLISRDVNSTEIPDSLLIIDVSNPVNHVIIGSYELGSNSTTDILFKDDHLFVLDSNTDDLRIYNVEDPQSILLISAHPLGQHPFTMDIDQDVIYIADFLDNTIQLIDISDLYSPSYINFIPVTQFTNTLYVENSFAYVLNPLDIDIKVIDFQDPYSPNTLSSFSLQSSPLNIPVDLYVRGNYIYVIDQLENTLKIIDRSDPYNLVLVSTFSLGNLSQSRDIQLKGNYAFITDWDYDGIHVIDIEDPYNPTAVSIAYVSQSPEKMAILENYAFIQDQQTGNVKTLKITSPLPLGVDENGNIVEIQSFPGDSINAGSLQQLLLDDSKLSITSGNTVDLGALSGWKLNNEEMYNLNSGNIGIGTDLPIGYGGHKVLEVVSKDQGTSSIVQVSNFDREHFLLMFGGDTLIQDPLLYWSDGLDLRFATNKNGFTEALRITHDGNVGIRTGGDLHLDLTIGDSDTGIQQEGDGELQVYTDFNPIMRFTKDSRVGIGKTVADEKLDVEGKIKAHGYVGDGSELTGIPYPDDSPINELQTLSVNGTELTLSNGNTVTIPVSAGGSGVWGENDDNGIYNINTQNVGIKTADPITSLHVGADQKVLLGADTTGYGSKVIWHPEKGALRAGTLDPGYFGEEAEWFDTDSVGSHSFAAGYNVLATGDMGSIALGHYNIARGKNGSFAAGTFNEAIGEEGTVALGAYNYVTGYFGAVALGEFNTAEGSSGCMAIGQGTVSSGSGGSIAMGYYTSNSGGNGSTAIGNLANNSGFGGSMSIGEYTNTTGHHGSISLGAYSEAGGDFGSIAIGDGAVSYGHHGSTAIGKSTISTSYGMTTLGIFNDTLPGWSRTSFVETDPAFLVGIGDGDFQNNYYARKTGLTLLKNGNLGIGTMTPDQQLTITHPINPVLRFERNGNPGFADWEMYAINGRIAIRGGGNGIGDELTEFFAIEGLDGRVTIPHLSGNGTRMVVTDGLGKLFAMDLPDNSGSTTTSTWFVHNNGNDIYYDQGKVGINAADPRTELSLDGTLAIGTNYASFGVGADFPANGALIEGNVGIGVSSNEINHVPQALTIIDDDESVLRFQGGGNLFDWEIASIQDVEGQNPTTFTIRGGRNQIGSDLNTYYTIEENGNAGNPVHTYNGDILLNQLGGSSILVDTGQKLTLGNTVQSEAFVIESNAQTTFKSNITGNSESSAGYGVVIDAKDNGLIIELDGETPNKSRNYVVFTGDTNNGNWNRNGRIKGQTSEDVSSSFDFIWNTAFQGLDLGFTVAEAISCGFQGDVFETVSVGLQGVAVAAQYAEYLVTSLANFGVAYESGSGDYAEWLPKENPDEVFRMGEVVGVHAGVVSKNTAGADHIMVVSKSPIVLGNMPEQGENPEHYEKIAFIGQVQTKVIGKVDKGDYILASGNHDGMGIAKSPNEMHIEDYKNIVGVAWSSSTGNISNIINVAVGINANDMSVQMEKQQQEIANLQNQINQLENQTAQILNHLGLGDDVSQAQNVSLVSRIETLENKAVLLGNSEIKNKDILALSDQEFRDIIKEQEHIIIHYFDEVIKSFEEMDIDINEFPELAGIFNDPIQAILDVKNGTLFPTLRDTIKRRLEQKSATE